MAVSVRLCGVAAALAAALSVGAASASAGVIAPPPPVLDLSQTISIPKPLTVTIDPVTESTLFAIPDLPPPRLLAFALVDDGPVGPATTIPLPDDVTPVGLWWDLDGYLHVLTREERTFRLCPDCGSVVETAPLATTIQFPGDAAAGWQTNVLGDYGSGESGSLFYGHNFSLEAPAGGLHPGAIDLMTDYAPIKHGRRVAGFVTFGEQTDTLAQFDDAAPPTLDQTLPGPPGVTQIGGLAADLNNLTPSLNGAGTFSLYVSSPSSGSPNSGNVYVSTDWRAGAGAHWSPISPTPLGTPASIDATCKRVAVADYGADAALLFDEQAAKGTRCENVADLAIKVAGGTAARQLTLAEAWTAYVDGGGDLAAALHLRHPRGRAARRGATVQAHGKVKLKAGEIAKAKLTFSKPATAAIEGAIGGGGKLTGKATLKFKNKAGQKLTVSQSITLTATRAGKPKLKAG